jgi:citrate lyase beta subunit
MHRSYLFAPGHNAKLLCRVFEAGPDAVILDLEDAVPPDAKQQARAMVAGVLAERSAWVRINTVRTGLSAADLDGNLQTLYARSHIVVASRAAGLGSPIDSVYPRLHDDQGLRQQAEFARSLGFFGKSAIHPRQLEVIHDVFTPSEPELTWAQAVLDAFAAADGNAVRLPDGEFVDLPGRRPRPAPAGARRPTSGRRRSIGVM